MKGMRRLVAALLLLSGVMVAGPAPVGAGSPCWDYKDSEQGFTRKMNASRAARGLGPLRLDRELTRVARWHTREMADRNLLAHTGMDRLGLKVTNWRLLGENVGVGGTVTTLHRAFMASPTHKANILHSSYNHVGVGTRKANGKMWVTVVFEARTDPGTTLSMPRC